MTFAEIEKKDKRRSVQTPRGAFSRPRMSGIRMVCWPSVDACRDADWPCDVRCRESGSIRLPSRGSVIRRVVTVQRSVLGLTDDLGDRDAVEKHSEQANVQMVDKLSSESKYRYGDHRLHYQVPSTNDAHTLHRSAAVAVPTTPRHVSAEVHRRRTGPASASP